MRRGQVESSSRGGCCGSCGGKGCSACCGKSSKGATGATGATGPSGTSSALTARVVSTIDQALVSGGNTPLEFNSPDFDFGGFFAGANPTRLTAPVDGIYSLVGLVRVNADVAPTTVSAFFRVNNLVLAAVVIDTGGEIPVDLNPSCTFQLDAGDYVELVVSPVGGAAPISDALLESSPAFSMTLIRAT